MFTSRNSLSLRPQCSISCCKCVRSDLSHLLGRSGDQSEKKDCGIMADTCASGEIMCEPEELMEWYFSYPRCKPKTCRINSGCANHYTRPHIVVHPIELRLYRQATKWRSIAYTSAVPATFRPTCRSKRLSWSDDRSHLSLNVIKCEEQLYHRQQSMLSCHGHIISRHEHDATIWRLSASLSLTHMHITSPTVSIYWNELGIMPPNFMSWVVYEHFPWATK